MVRKPQIAAVSPLWDTTNHHDIAWFDPGKINRQWKVILKELRAEKTFHRFQNCEGTVVGENIDTGTLHVHWIQICHKIVDTLIWGAYSSMSTLIIYILQNLRKNLSSQKLLMGQKFPGWESETLSSLGIQVLLHMEMHGTQTSLCFTYLWNWLTWNMLHRGM